MLTSWAQGMADFIRKAYSNLAQHTFPVLSPSSLRELLQSIQLPSLHLEELVQFISEYSTQCPLWDVLHTEGGAKMKEPYALPSRKEQSGCPAS